MNISESAALRSLEKTETSIPQDTSERPTQRNTQPTQTASPPQQHSNPPPRRDPLEEPPRKEQQVPVSAIEQIVKNLVPQNQNTEDISDEELDRQLKVFRVNQDFAKKFFGPDADDQHVAVLQEMADGITAHLVELIGASTRLTRQEFQTQLQPFTELQEREKRTEFTSILTQTYPTLRGKEQVIQKSMDYLKSTGFKPKSGAEAARAVAQVTTQLLQSVDPTFDLLGPVKTSAKPPSMASLKSSSGGGGSGSGTQNKQTSSKPSWDGIFD